MRGKWKTEQCMFLSVTQIEMWQAYLSDLRRGVEKSEIKMNLESFKIAERSGLNMICMQQGGLIFCKDFEGLHIPTEFHENISAIPTKKREGLM